MSGKAKSKAVIIHGDCNEMLKGVPSGRAQLVVTSPPYNLGKEYEQKRLQLDEYIAQQAEVIKECVRCLGPKGSICWQVGNYVDKKGIVPLDIVLYPVFIGLGLTLRNRIVWTFEHGLNCMNRFSGRYETILWFTKTDNYIFNLDPVRVPQKYPGKKYFKGPKKGEYSCNPLGKNPGDVWVIPNVKNNHVEKTEHPCQFPVELVERLVLSMTDKGGLVIDPFAGVGSALVAAVKHGRRAIGADTVKKYCLIARKRIGLAEKGELRTRAMNTPVHKPCGAVATRPAVTAG